MYCPHCETSLEGLAEFRCPACGEAFEPEQLRHAPRVPWERPGAGPGGLVRTVGLVLRRPDRLRRARTETLDAVRARKFRYLLLLWSALWSGLAAGVAGGSWMTGLLGLAGAGLWLVLAAAAVDLVHASPWMGPTARAQARALSCYSAAPLAMSPLPAGLLIARTLLGLGPYWAVAGLEALFAASAGLAAALWLLRVLGDFVVTHPHGRRYAVPAGVLLAGLWTLSLAAVAVAGLTVRYGWAWGPIF